MKTLYILLVTICFSAFAKAETATTFASEVVAVNWTGTYTTSFGEIILHQKGKSVVGTYKNAGAIRSTKVQGNEMYLRFDNGSSTGYAKFTKTNNGFKGAWSWDNKRNEGSWDGTKKGNATQKSLQGAWITNFQNIVFIHNSANIVAGHYGNNGGKIWGKYNPSTKTLVGKYTTKQGAKQETLAMKFSGNSFSGKYNNAAMGSWTGRKNEVHFKITLNSFTCKGTDNLRNFEQGRVTVTTLVTNGTKNTRPYYATESIEGNGGIYRDDRIKKYGVGSKINTSTAYATFMLKETDILNTSKLWNEFYFNEFSLNIYDMGISLGTQNNNLKEIVNFLQGKTQASDYPVQPNTGGRRYIPGSTDYFFLQTIAGKRVVRGYALMVDEKKGKTKFEYEYTVELLD